MTCDKSAVSLLESRAWRYIRVIRNNNDYYADKKKEGSGRGRHERSNWSTAGRSDCDTATDVLELDQTEQEYELGEAVRPSIIHRLAKVVTTIAKGVGVGGGGAWGGGGGGGENKISKTQSVRKTGICGS